MKPSEIKQIYVDACRAANGRPLPDSAQQKVWYQVLGSFDVRDVEQALVQWWQAESWLPSPADLKPLAESARRQSAARALGHQETIFYNCPKCRAPFAASVECGDTRPRLCLCKTQDGSMIGCRVRLTETARIAA
jgi:hypothetical protein